MAEGLSTPLFTVGQETRETENTYNTNVDKLAIELSLKQSSMAELEWYKEGCEKDSGIKYYDTFKRLDKKDIEADTRRVKLADFWDDIIEKWEGHELPSDFESQNKWMEEKEKSRSSRRQRPRKCQTTPTPKTRKSFHQRM